MSRQTLSADELTGAAEDREKCRNNSNVMHGQPKRAGVNTRFHQAGGASLPITLERSGC